MVVHNYPSGKPEPSLEDAQSTQQLYDARELLRIELAGNVVIGQDSYRVHFGKFYVGLYVGKISKIC
jgi:DNA repair protein RadC